MTTMETVADRLTSALVSRRAGGHCELRRRGCSTLGTDAHHLFSRSRHATRWRLDCLTWVCRSCHQWAHGHRPEFVAWISGRNTDGWYAEVYRSSRHPVKWRPDELLELVAALKRALGRD